MFDIEPIKALPKDEYYETLLLFSEGLMEGESDVIANLANISSLLFNTLEDINWAGFYLMRNGELVLGPFQGKPACIRIQVGKGVCGTAAATKQTQLIEDVHTFEGHIPCDGASNSEIVVPLIYKGEVKGVLDIDSPKFCRFLIEDQIALEKLVEIIIKKCTWEEL